MITKIVARLRAQLPSTVSVVPFGDALPAAPYVVVKQEDSIRENWFVYRIIGHMLPGQQTFLEDLMNDNVKSALDGYEADDRHGNLNKLYAQPSRRAIIINNDDKTLSMERVYEMPGRLSPIS